LILHTAAYWLMLTMRNAIAKRSLLSVAADQNGRSPHQRLFQTEKPTNSEK
jgi:hypothetical protein